MVKLKYCDKCACDMPAHFRKCPNCGAPNRQRLLSKWWVKALAFTLFLAAVYYMSGMDWPWIDQLQELI